MCSRTGGDALVVSSRQTAADRCLRGCSLLIVFCCECVESHHVSAWLAVVSEFHAALAVKRVCCPLAAHLALTCLQRDKVSHTLLLLTVLRSGSATEVTPFRQRYRLCR